jgi:hypothetical protein
MLELIDRCRRLAIYLVPVRALIIFWILFFVGRISYINILSASSKQLVVLDTMLLGTSVAIVILPGPVYEPESNRQGPEENKIARELYFLVALTISTRVLA